MVGSHSVCHCEERSEEAISAVEGMNDEIAAACFAWPRNDMGGRYGRVR